MRRPYHQLHINFVSPFGLPARGSPLGSGARGPAQFGESVFEPPVDLYETEGEMVVRVEIAGMDPKEIGVTLDEVNSRLTIAGHRAERTTEPWRRFYNMEIVSGPFRRVVQLPKQVRALGATASYDSGLLQVRLPLRGREHGEPRSVPIE